MDRRLILTVCPYCGCGCGFYLEITAPVIYNSAQVLRKVNVLV
jgi:predicted molibdopterin-dependent oxidoreductase YjgC